MSQRPDQIRPTWSLASGLEEHGPSDSGLLLLKTKDSLRVVG